jgi:ankyrin repeat protein
VQVVAAVSIDKIMEEEFKKLASLCRHSKFSEAEDLLNQPDWRLPIDYQDSQGNSILHIVAQNGSKRLAKLCLKVHTACFTCPTRPPGGTPVDKQIPPFSSFLFLLGVQRGASINLQNIYGNTCLHFAYGMGYHEWGDYMVSKGADETIKNAEGLSCFEGVDKRELSLL